MEMNFFFFFSRYTFCSGTLSVKYSVAIEQSDTRIFAPRFWLKKEMGNLVSIRYLLKSKKGKCLVVLHLKYN